MEIGRADRDLEKSSQELLRVIPREVLLPPVTVLRRHHDHIEGANPVTMLSSRRWQVAHPSTSARRGRRSATVLRRSHTAVKVTACIPALHLLVVPRAHRRALRAGVFVAMCHEEPMQIPTDRRLLQRAVAQQIEVLHRAVPGGVRPVQPPCTQHRCSQWAVHLRSQRDGARKAH